MTEVKKSKTTAWILFLVSLTAFVLLMTFMPEIFWMSLPGTFTGFAMLMDWL